MKVNESLDDLPEAEMPDLSKIDFGLMQCAMQCMQAYMVCEENL